MKLLGQPVQHFHIQWRRAQVPIWAPCHLFQKYITFWYSTTVHALLNTNTSELANFNVCVYTSICCNILYLLYIKFYSYFTTTLLHYNLNHTSLTKTQKLYLKSIIARTISVIRTCKHNFDLSVKGVLSSLSEITATKSQLIRRKRQRITVGLTNAPNAYLICSNKLYKHISLLTGILRPRR